MLASTHSPSLGHRQGPDTLGSPGGVGKLWEPREQVYILPRHSQLQDLDRALLSQPLFPLLQNEGEAASLGFTGASSPFYSPGTQQKTYRAWKENKTATAY